MVDQVLKFDLKGYFNSYYAARHWCKENGYSLGPMARDLPIGLMYGDWDIAEWGNLSDIEKHRLDGTMVCITNFHNGPVHIVLKAIELCA